MKTRITAITILFLFLLSCNKEDSVYILKDFIIAGQKEGSGIQYNDLMPDINCTIADPWEKTDTLINLDLNKDGIDDFSLERNMYHPSLLGADYESVKLIPLNNNEICIAPGTSWLDTISLQDTINLERNWTNEEALIYSYFWEYGGETYIRGLWKDVKEAHKNFIGFKLSKDGKPYYGWIGMNSDTTFRSFDFYLTDYAILKEYPE